ncbi:hypothetical protein D9M69_710140 [compost metagenome]
MQQQLKIELGVLLGHLDAFADQSRVDVRPMGREIGAPVLGVEAHLAGGTLDRRTEAPACIHLGQLLNIKRDMRQRVL